MNRANLVGVTDMSAPRFAFIDTTGSVILTLTDYDNAGSFSDGLAPVSLANKGWGFIDKKGHLIIDAQFKRVQGFSEGLAGVEIAGKWGFIDRTGKTVIEPQFEWVNKFSEGLALVVKNKSVRGLEQPTPARRIPRIVMQSFAFNANSNPMSQDTDRQTLIIDKSGQTIIARDPNEVVQIKFDEDARFSEGLLEAFDRRTGRFGFVDRSCNYVIPPRYDQVSRFSNGLARVTVMVEGQEKVGFINRSGKFVIAPKFNTDADFQNSSDFSDGLALITEGLNPTIIPRGRWAYVNTSGDIELITEFEESHSFKEGLALVEDNNRWGFIDKKGNVVITPQFQFARDFSDGLALVEFEPA